MDGVGAEHVCQSLSHLKAGPVPGGLTQVPDQAGHGEVLQAGLVSNEADLEKDIKTSEQP